MGVDFKKLSPTINISCWYESDTIDVSIQVNTLRKLHCEFDHRSFYKDFLEILTVVNATSFEITVYSKGEISNWSTSINYLQRQYIKWSEQRNEPALIQDMEELMKL